MKDGDNWPELIAHYRIRHKLTQAEFAQSLNVTQQTVSRWESGKQTPDPQTQQLLRSVVGLTSLSTRAAWQQRVNLSWGLEALFDKAWRCLAVSEPLAKALGVSADAVVGRALTEIAGIKTHDNAMAQTPFFEGGMRALKVRAELSSTSGPFTADIEFWPVLTSGDEIVAHAVAYASTSGTPDNRIRSFRVLQFQAVTMDGRVVHLEGEAARNERDPTM